MFAYVICSSHRSREKVYDLLGEQRHREFYNWNVSYHLTEIPADKLDEAISIKGVRKGKFSDDWSECWPSFI